jgi:hypothetical protein
MAFTDYVAGSATGGGGTVSAPEASYWSHSKCRRAYLDYLNSKKEEIDEQKDARRYRHGSQYTDEQIRVLNRRKQPVVTFNRIGRKIDGIIGLVEKLRQDPKAYPRTPKHEQGAELATAVLNFVLDQQDWKSKSPLCAEDGAVDGIGGLEINLVPSEKEGDYEIDIDAVDPEDFFYDPRSFRLDFTDARYMGIAKWMDIEEAIELYPDKEDELRSAGNESELTSDSDRDNRWFSEDTNGTLSQVRIVDLWYKHGGEWCYCTFTGSSKLIEGQSYLIDEQDKTFCKYIMYSSSVDHEGDRYGFVRNLKSAQDEINLRRSKGLHELNTRRIIAENGAFDDIETARREAAKPDGVVLRNKGFEAEFDDAAKMANIEGALKFLEDAKNEIENFGPNPALMGDLEGSSGRAIALLQQAGVAELGPFVLAYRGWKIRVYRAIWNTVQRHWTGERWVRVTDEEDVAQFVQINGMQVGPNGLPAMVNALGELDVDIILDEGPDHVNMMADAYDTLTVLAGKGAQVSPQVLIELSPLPMSVKKRVKEMQEQAAQQPNPEIEKMQFEMEAEKAKIGISQQKAQSDIQIKQQQMQADFVMEQQRLALEAEKMRAQLELEREKAGLEIQLEREKADVQLGLEREKAVTQSGLERDKAHTHATLERDKMNMKVEGEKAVKEQKIKDASNEAATRAITQLTKSFDGLKEAFIAPKKLIRDKQGRAIGSETVI